LRKANFNLDEHVREQIGASPHPSLQIRDLH
jgi:hypothetical protein